MNRVLFVGLCLIGMMIFAFSSANNNKKEQSKTEVAKEDYKPVFY